MRPLTAGERQRRTDALKGHTAVTVALDPTTVTVRRGAGTLGPYTVRIVAAEEGRTVRSEGGVSIQADARIIAEAGGYVPRRGDRVKADTGQVYRVEYVAPLQDYRVEVDAVYEG